MKDLLKFITCGSVDDGKSTLIGHMLYDAKLLFADQRQALEMDSKVGSAGGELDYSLLLDGLAAEREQGITIDVAYRYFSTENRSFIVADTPGHEEYTRNMAVGASFANLAVILIDAEKGVLVQTRRHTRICALMGIRDFVFAVNKMDLVQYDAIRFEAIRKSILELMSEYRPASLAVIPVSAKKGDNLTNPGKMLWYRGETLLNYLEHVDVYVRPDSDGFCMPVQRVCRPDGFFRGFQGEVSMGSVALGEELTVLPSREKANVSKIITADRPANQAQSGSPVTICLDREIDVSRGCVLVRGMSPHVGTYFAATLLWMDDTPLQPGRNFLLKLGTQSVPAAVMKIQYRIDVNTGERKPCDSLRKNEIALCEISTNAALVFEAFEKNSVLGELILIDRVTNATSACGVVDRSIDRSDNLTWHAMEITRAMREAQNHQRARTIWFTGLSGAGKSTLAGEIEKRLFTGGQHTMLLDGDNVRMGLNRGLGFSEKDRVENIRRVAEVAKLMNDAGLLVLTSFISPYARDRRAARDIIGDSFVEVYVSTSLAECEKRDVKGLYKKARNGEIEHFTGVTDPYEPPEYAEIIVETDGRSVGETADELMEKLKEYI